MGRSDSGRLELVDLMLLVAGCAVSLSGSLFLDNQMFGGSRYLFGLFNRLDPATWDVWDAVSVAEGVFAGGASLFGAWILILPLVALRRSRSMRGRLFRGPGLTACLAALGGIGFCAIGVILAVVLQDWSPSPFSPFSVWEVTPVVELLFALAGTGVATAWFVQAVTGRWRARANAIDRLGRAVGWMWIAAGLVFVVAIMMQ